MIDLTKEDPLTISAVALLFAVHRRTVEGWFRAGLERAKLRGRVYTTKQAIQRFAQFDEPHHERHSDPTEQAIRTLETEFGI